MINTLRISITALLLLLMFTSSERARATQSTAKTDDATLALKDFAGHTRNLNDHRGKVVILNFWATWCKPCREELLILNSLESRYRERGVAFVAASADDRTTQKQVHSFVRRLEINFPVWVGATKADTTRFGLGDELPATAIIDLDGQIVGRILGPLSHADLQRRIEWLLGDRQTPPPVPLVDNLERNHSHDHTINFEKAEGNHGSGN